MANNNDISDFIGRLAKTGSELWKRQEYRVEVNPLFPGFLEHVGFVHSVPEFGIVKGTYSEELLLIPLRCRRLSWDDVISGVKKSTLYPPLLE